MTTHNTDINGLAQEFTFGVEIETIVPYLNEIRIGNYHNGIQVPYLPHGWTAQRDGSIRGTRDTLPCEIVSPILKGEAGIKELIKVVKILKEKGHKVNDSCGVHVHVGFGGKTATELAKLITITAYLEKALYAITGTKSRERGSYCDSVKQYDNAKKYRDEMRVADGARYKVLNIRNLTPGGKGTVEFRCFSGSLNVEKIVGWVQVSLGIVEKALTCKRCPAWDGKKPTGVWKKEGDGATECERLLAYLCWGNYGKHPSHLRAYGWISNEIKQDTVKATLRTLAAKYDRQR